jgi:hypothetical protein
MVVQERPELVARAVRELASEPAELDLIARSAP